MDLDWDFRLSLINDILKENIHLEHFIVVMVNPPDAGEFLVEFFADFWIC